MKFSLAGIIAFTASAAAFAPSSMVRYDFVISFLCIQRAHPVPVPNKSWADSNRFEFRNSDGGDMLNLGPFRPKTITKQLGMLRSHMLAQIRACFIKNCPSRYEMFRWNSLQFGNAPEEMSSGGFLQFIPIDVCKDTGPIIRLLSIQNTSEDSACMYLVKQTK